jgi:hypothetical protein
MAKIRERLYKAWIDWNFETTPEIFLVVTLFGAFVFTAVTFAFSVLAAIRLLQESQSANILGQVVLCAPPAIVLALWLGYRIVWFRRLFPTTSRA